MIALARHPRAPVILLAWSSAAALLAALSAAFYFVVLPRLPELDGYWFPIVRATAPPTEISRDQVNACFALPLQKIAPGKPIKSQFFVEASIRDTWLAPTPADAWPINPVWKNRAVGEPWVQRWCFETGTISDGQRIRVSGYAVHKRRPFFETETALPTFVIPALH